MFEAALVLSESVSRRSDVPAHPVMPAIANAAAIRIDHRRTETILVRGLRSVKLGV